MAAKVLLRYTKYLVLVMYEVLTTQVLTRLLNPQECLLLLLIFRFSLEQFQFVFLSNAAGGFLLAPQVWMFIKIELLLSQNSRTAMLGTEKKLLLNCSLTRAKNINLRLATSDACLTKRTQKCSFFICLYIVPGPTSTIV